MKVAPKTFNKFAWSISGLTEVIGQSFEASSDEGRILSWADEDGYWLTLICDDDGKVHAIFTIVCVKKCMWLLVTVAITTLTLN